MPKKPSASDLKAILGEKRDRPKITSKDLLSTGCTLLNLACSGRATGAVAKGTYLFYVGDSSTGKTWSALTLFAEATLNKHFQGYRFIFDNAENGALMDMERYFGPKVAEAMESPATLKGEPTSSTTVEEFYYHVYDALEVGRPFIYVLDSMDALDTEDESEKFTKDREKHAEGKEAGATYGTAKAKANSTNMRRIVGRLKDTGSILVVLSQTRDKIGFGSQFNPKSRSGGKSLRFYAHLEIWTAIRERLKKPGTDRVYGTKIQAKVEKNRVSGWEGELIYTFLKRHGVDDVGTSIDFLLEEKHWSATKGVIQAPELDFVGKREKLIRKIEEEGLERDLAMVTTEVWLALEEASTVRRKNKYQE